MSIEASVRTHLLADATVSGLVAERMFPAVREESSAVPALSYEMRFNDSQMNLAGMDSQLRNARLAITCYARTFADTIALSEAVHARMDVVTSAFASVALPTVEDSFLPQPKIQTRTVEFSLWYDEGAVIVVPPFSPSDLANLEGWWRFNTGITESGGLVSNWADQINSYDLVQTTETNKPTVSAGVITFDGVDNFLQVASMDLDQPHTLYVLLDQVTWVHQDGIVTGTWGGQTLYQVGSGSGISYYAGVSLAVTDVGTGAFNAVAVVGNGASSVLQVGSDGTPATGNAGTLKWQNIYLGARVGAQTSNIAVKEMALYSAAHDADDRASVLGYLEGL